MSERQPVTASEMLELARSSGAADRERLLLHMGDLCAARPWGGAAAAGVASDIMLTLARQAELAVRAELALRLADTPWAPRDLIILLAYDEIEVADPVLAGSPVLTETDLLAIAENLGETHRRSLARRPGLAETVSDRLALRGEAGVLPILLSNRSARLSESALTACAEAAEQSPDLWRNILDRENLPMSIASLAYRQAGEALRASLEIRFPEAKAQFEAALNGETAPPKEEAPDPETLARRLTAKLEASGTLTSGFAMKCLSQGKLILFETALARLARIEPEILSSALGRRQSYALALVCRGAELDRSVFPSIHAQLYNAGRLHEPLKEPVSGQCAAVFRDMSPPGAAAALRRIGANA